MSAKFAYVNMPLGERVKQVRESKGISQRKLATTIFVDASAMCLWEKEKGIYRYRACVI